MEDEARQILRTVLTQPLAPEADLGARVRARFATFGDVDLPIPARELQLEAESLPAGAERSS
jgi:hypothetical protein